MAMPEFRPWADLPTELLLLIVHALDNPSFASYGSIRGVCSALVAICDTRSRLACTKARDVKWTAVEVAAKVKKDYLVDLAYDAGSGKVYCVTACGDVHVLDLATTRRNTVAEPLHQGAERADLQLRFDPAAAYAPPYDTASKLTGFKRIFLVGGSLYQVWCNTACAVSWAMPGGDWFRMEEGEVLVLKYDPAGRRPCWHQVRDLGGCSVFTGKNIPAVLRAGDVPGVRPNCLYWVHEWSGNKPMVFDMATGTSTLHPAAAKASPRSRTVCWYF